MLRTVAEWNRLSATIREAHLLTLLKIDCAVLIFLLILPVTSAARHSRAPTTVYPVC